MTQPEIRPFSSEQQQGEQLEQLPQVQLDRLPAAVAEHMLGYYGPIETHLGAHGLASSDPTEHAQHEMSGNVPTDRDYAYVDYLMGTLRPGIDTLFMESYGYTRQPAPPLPMAFLESQARAGDTNASFLIDIAQKSMNERLKEAEAGRKSYGIDLWHYAELLAEARGVRVVYADQDAAEKEQIAQLSEKTRAELYASDDPKDREFLVHTGRLRSRRAVQMVTAWAIGHLPPNEAPLLAPDDKPKLVLLFGGGHTDELVEAFAEVGVEVNFRSMPTSSAAESAEEQRARAAGKLATPITFV